MVFYIVISIIGTTISEIAYCFHLLDIIGRSPTLKNVIKAVTTNIRQLALTTTLAIIVIYLYSIFAFYFVDSTYNNSPAMKHDGSTGLENLCTTLLQCFWTTLNYVITN